MIPALLAVLLGASLAAPLGAARESLNERTARLERRAWRLQNEMDYEAAHDPSRRD